MGKSFPSVCIKACTFVICLLVLLVACAKQPENNTVSAPTELTISAAASLQHILSDLESEYRKHQPETKLNVHFGASGALQQQILQGAPVDLFLSADQNLFDALMQSGHVAEQDKLDLVENELVLIVHKDQSGIQRFGDLISDRVEHISIGMPETVPAGKYAKEALENMGLWSSLESKMVYAKDVRQVLTYVETGNVSAGIVYATDTMTSQKVKVIDMADANTHSPIIYSVGIIQNSKNKEGAKDFYSFLQSEQAIKIFEDYGFKTR